LIMWMSHPAWPSMTWQTYTYDYETPGSYFGARKAQEPLHIQMNMPDNKVMIINSTRNAYKNMTVTVRYYTLDGKASYTKTEKYNVPANSTVDCFVPQLTGTNHEYVFFRLELKDNKGKVVSLNDYWNDGGNIQTNKALNQLNKPTLKLTKKGSKTSTLVYELQNTSRELAVAIKLNAKDIATGEIILPAYFSDGYINLLPGEKRTITLELPENVSKSFNIVAEGYNLDSIVLL